MPRKVLQERCAGVSRWADQPRPRIASDGISSEKAGPYCFNTRSEMDSPPLLRAALARLIDFSSWHLTDVPIRTIMSA